MNLREITLRPVAAAEEARFQTLLDAHHYLGSLPKIGHTLWYVATWRGQWLALLSFCAAAWKCAARDRWIGWDFRYQYDRLHLIANNARFLILPGHHYPNLASRVLSLCERRLTQDWTERFGHPLWLLETFIDPRYFHGTIYRAANWEYVGDTRGFHRTRTGYSTTAQAPKRVFVRPLVARARAHLSQPILDPAYHHGAPKLMLSAEHMRSLPAFFADIPDPRRAQGRRHPLPVVLAIAAAAVLCGARGYKAIGEWAEDLGQKARVRFRCRYRNGCYEVPSRTRSAMCLSASILAFSTAPCKAGTRSMARSTRVLPSMARPCAMPSTTRVVRPISSAWLVIEPRPATPKKSRRSTRRRHR